MSVSTNMSLDTHSCGNTLPASRRRRPERHVSPRCRRMRGFTLIEVMITVAIVAILAAVALPSYTDYVTRSKIVEATSSLTDMRMRLEQYFLDNRQYPAACIAAAAGPAPAGKIYLPASSKYFTVTCALTATTYTVTATGNAAQGMARLRLHGRPGQQPQDDRSAQRLVRRRRSSTCWVNRKNGDC